MSKGTMIQKNNVTVYDIAKAAGVAQSTVSKALNGYSSINKKTTEKILRIAEELNYEPNMIARSLVMKKSRTIGLIVEDISNPFYAEAAKVILDRSKETDYSVIISDRNNDTSIKESINRLNNRKVDGMIVSAVNRHETFEMLETTMPIVFFNQSPEGKNFNRIKLDDYKAARIAMNHLIKNGHRRIGFISGSISRSTYFERYNGYKDALAESKIRFNEEMIFMGEHYLGSSRDFFSEEMLEIKEREKITAFLAASDAIAIEVMGGLANKGYSVPDDISIIGIGDIHISESPMIGLTTISQNIDKMAVEAFDILVKILSSEQNNAKIKPIKKVLKPVLIERNTVRKI